MNRPRPTGDRQLTCLWFSEPHTPVVAAEEFQALYRNAAALNAAKATSYGGDQVKRNPKWDKLPLYYGCVTMLDHHIGRLLTYLDNRDLSENTIVVFTSDNGPEHRTRNMFRFTRRSARCQGTHSRRRNSRPRYRSLAGEDQGGGEKFRAHQWH